MIGEAGKEWVREHEPQMQRAVAALVEVLEAIDRAVGPQARVVIRSWQASCQTAYRRTTIVASQLGARLPEPVREAGITAGAAARHAARTVPGAARSVVNDRRGAAETLRRAPAAATSSVTRSVPLAGKARDAAAPVAGRVAGAGRKAAADPAGTAREAAEQLRTQLLAALAEAPDTIKKAGAAVRDPSAIGAVAGAAAGKVMDTAAAGSDAVIRGTRAARQVPGIVNEALRRAKPEEPGGI